MITPPGERFFNGKHHETKILNRTLIRIEEELYLSKCVEGYTYWLVLPQGRTSRNWVGFCISAWPWHTSCNFSRPCPWWAPRTWRGTGDFQWRPSQRYWCSYHNRRISTWHSRSCIWLGNRCKHLRNRHGARSWCPSLPDWIRWDQVPSCRNTCRPFSRCRPGTRCKFLTSLLDKCELWKRCGMETSDLNEISFNLLTHRSQS